MKKNAVLLCVFLLSAWGYAGEFDQFAIKSLGDISSYSHKEGYSPAVSDVYLGYDAQGNVISGAAMRSIKTYATVNGLVAVTKKDGQWVISSASIPDIARIKEPAKQQKVTDAIKAFSGSTVKDANGNLQKVDAVTGATRYQESIYLYFNLLAKTVVEEIEKNPDWAKTPLSK
ncbi:MAG: hypothetical protein IT583_07770 [Verrucomicrobia bacterium]|nr:hypothetical protein [Verrucomicrobiota bacterium]